MNYNGKLFLAFFATLLAGASIGYLLSDSDRVKIANKLAHNLLAKKKKGFNDSIDSLRSQLHEEAEFLANEVEKIAV